MKKLLVVCGPTATGKTKLAIHLSKALGGEVISADSRQVYKEMDIGTGKDLTVNSKLQILNYKFNAKKIGFYEVGGAKIWGYDLVDPKKEFSVSQYTKIVQGIIKDILRRGKLPILTGGSGLYIKGVVDGIPTSSIAQNKKLREEFSSKSVNELFEILRTIDPIKSASMNISDRKNPRRLVRAIEIGKWRLEVGSKKWEKNMGSEKWDMLFIGLTAPRKELNIRIEERVYKRLKQGIRKEIQSLLSKDISWDDQAMNALCYKQWRGFFKKEKSEEQVINEWISEEKKYAKRQIVWFKKDKRIIWSDISQGGWIKSVEKLVINWYYND